MKILGIDYGEKRVGVAISDETKTFARELSVLSPAEFWAQLDGLVETEKISLIVLGWPLNMSGQETPKTQEVKVFKLKIETQTGLPVEVIDERLSTQMTQNLPGGDKNKDSLAAQIILQNFLDRNKN